MPRDIWPRLREPAYNTEPSRSEFGWNRVFPPPAARTPLFALVKNKSYCLSRGTEGATGASRRRPRCRFLPPLPPPHPLASPAILPALSWRCRGTAEAPAEAPAPLPRSRGAAEAPQRHLLPSPDPAAPGHSTPPEAGRSTRAAAARGPWCAGLGGRAVLRRAGHGARAWEAVRCCGARCCSTRAVASMRAGGARQAGEPNPLFCVVFSGCFS